MYLFIYERNTSVHSLYTISREKYLTALAACLRDSWLEGALIQSNEHINSIKPICINSLHLPWGPPALGTLLPSAVGTELLEQQEHWDVQRWVPLMAGLWGTL